MEFVKANEFKGKGKYLAIAAVLAMVISCVAVSLPADADVTAEGKILYIHGTLDSGIDGGYDQIIIVDDDLVIDGENKHVVANNNFIVKEGVTLIIKEGSFVDIQSGKAEINGNVICEAGTYDVPTFSVHNGASVDIKGDMAVNGLYGFYTAPGAAVNLDGKLTIAETGSAYISGLTINNGSKLDIQTKGDVKTYIQSITAESGSQFDLAGEILFEKITINDGAVFTITETGSVLSHDVLSSAITNKGNIVVKGEFGGTIDNWKSVVADSDKDCFYIVVVRDGSTFDMRKDVVMATFSDEHSTDVDLGVALVHGLIVSADPEFTGVKVSGSPATSAEAGFLQIIGNVLFYENMEFPANVLVTIDESGHLKVISYITMIQNTETAPIEGTGTITFAGDSETGYGVVQTAVPLVIKSPKESGLHLNGVYYTKGIYHYYTTLEYALKANPDYIKVYGDIIIDTDTIIPNGMYVDMTEANSVTITSRATVTVEDGGIFENGNVPIIVQGTLILHNTPTSKTNVELVDSDVKVESGIYSKFTNLKRALDEAQPGDTITIKRNHVRITEDTVIPEGVKLLIGAAENVLELDNGAKLTVDGELNAHPGTYLITNGTTIVNGCFLFDEPFGTYFDDIAGAYYTLDGVNTISSLGYIPGKESRINDLIFINGAVKAGDVTFTGGDKMIDCMPGSSLDAGTIVLDGFRFDAVAADSVSGEFVAGTGAVDFNSAKGFTIMKIDNGKAWLHADVIPAAEDASAIFSGNCVTEADFKPGVTIGFKDDANVNFTEDFEFYQDLVTIPAGATVVAEKSMTAKDMAVGGALYGRMLSADSINVAKDGYVGNTESVLLNVGNLTVDGTVNGGNGSVLNLGTVDSTTGSIVLGDDCSMTVDSDINSLYGISAGDGFTLKANNIKIANGNLKESASMIAENNLDLGAVTFGNNASLTAESATLKDVVLGDGSSDIVAGDLYVTGDTVFGNGCVLNVDNMYVSGNLVLSSGIKAVVNGVLEVTGTLKTVQESEVNAKDSFTVKKDVNVSGDMDLSIINLVNIGGDLNVVGNATMGSFSTSTFSGGSFVSGNTSVASTGTLTIPEKTIWACLKDLTVDGKLIVGKNSTAAVGSSFSDENGTVAIAGSAETAEGSLFTATNLVLPGTFTNSGNVIIGAVDVNGTSTIDGTVNAKAGTFTMYRTVYITGKILTDEGKFVASKIYAGVNESIFGNPVAPATSVPTLGPGVTLTSAGVAYVSPAVKTNGCFEGFKHTDYYKGNDHYLTVFANPGAYSDKADGKNRNIDSIYAAADDAYVNGWRATKEVRNAEEAAKARVTSPYGTYETVWMNTVYEIYNFKLYAADETATPMIGKVENGQVTPLTLYKSGLNCYESPVNLKAGTYRVSMTYADGHQEKYIDNPMVVNGVPQSNYDVTFGGNPDNKEQVDYLIQFSYSEEEPPVVVDNSLNLTEILLIVLVILIIVVVIVLIWRARRS